MYKFKDKIYEVKRLLSEEEGDLPPPPELPPEEEPAAAEEPAATDLAAAPEPAAASEDPNAPSDMQKVRMDTVESVRKALIINPNDVDQSLYAKLTSTTTLDNLDDMEATVQELVNNYYPDTQL